MRLYNEEIIELVDILPNQPELREVRAHTAEETEAYLRSLTEETDISVEMWALSIQLGECPALPPIEIDRPVSSMTHKRKFYEGD